LVRVTKNAALECFTQQLNQHFRPAREGYLIEDEVCRHQSPEPAFVSAGAIAGLVAVDHRFMGQLLFQFRAGFGDRFAGFFPGVLNTAQTERYAKNLSRLLLHYAARNAANHGQISDQRSQFRAEMALHLLRQLCLRGLSAVRTDSALTSVLRDMRFDGRQFGHLMPSRLALRQYLPVAAGQPAIAMTATGGQQIDHLIDTFRRRQPAPMSAMARLATRLTATPALFPAPLALLASQAV
jgi:hypothetical protein